MRTPRKPTIAQTSARSFLLQQHNGHQRGEQQRKLIATALASGIRLNAMISMSANDWQRARDVVAPAVVWNTARPVCGRMNSAQTISTSPNA